MAVQRHLPNAPITEAVIDLQVETDYSFTFTDFEKAFSNLDFGYRQSGAVITGQIRIVADSLSGSAQSSGSSERIGMRLHSADDLYVALFRVNGFSLSRLPPYQNWNELEKEARRVWEIYRKRWPPKNITRVATRYINNLHLPLQSGQNLNEFIDTLTELPKELPQGISGFVQQFQIVDPETKGIVRLALVWDGTGQVGDIPVILDLDASSQENFDPLQDAVWIRLRELRGLKNRGFFGVLKEEAIRNYL